MLHKILWTAFGILTIVVSTATAQTTTAQTTATDSAAAIVGKWTGTYDGGSSGNFEMVISRDGTGKLTGQITLLPPDGSRYPINLKTVTYQGSQLNATYDDSQSGGEVSIKGRPDNTGMKGTWDAGGGQATGSWQLTRANR